MTVYYFGTAQAGLFKSLGCHCRRQTAKAKRRKNAAKLILYARTNDKTIIHFGNNVVIYVM